MKQNETECDLRALEEASEWETLAVLTVAASGAVMTISSSDDVSYSCYAASN